MKSKIKIVVLFQLIFIMALGFYIPVEALYPDQNAPDLYYNGSSKYLLSYGDNWFKISTDKLYDVYFKIKTETGLEQLSATLYIDGESTKHGTEFYGNELYLIQDYLGKGEHYLLINNPYWELEVEITTEVFPSTVNDKYEPNNWFYNATPITEDINKSETYDEIIHSNLGKVAVSGTDIDIYKYSASEPCMLTVNFSNESYNEFEHEYDYPGELDIYIGDTLYASSLTTGKGDIKQIDSNFSFNHTHGDCYFKVYNGFGDYTLKIKRSEYQPQPILLIRNPLQMQLNCEFDTIEPLVSILGNDEMNVSYSYIKNSSTLDNEIGTSDININTNTFSNVPLLQFVPSQMTDGEISPNYIEFSAQYIYGSKLIKSHRNSLLYDDTPPKYDSINVERNDDDIEVNVINADDTIGLAQRPYRYRVYPSGAEQTAYSDWMTSSYYNQWINGDGGEYIVDVQIRDMIAEKYQGDTTKDLSNHIVTYTETVGIN